MRQKLQTFLLCAVITVAALPAVSAPSRPAIEGFLVATGGESNAMAAADLPSTIKRPSIAGRLEAPHSRAGC
jgi:hypothetical protein